MLHLSYLLEVSPQSDTNLDQTGNNYDISNKFQKICIVLPDKNISNQRIRLSKNFFVYRMIFFWIVFRKNQSYLVKLKPISQVLFLFRIWHPGKKWMPCWTRIVFFKIVNILIDLHYMLFLKSWVPSKVIFFRTISVI